MFNHRHPIARRDTYGRTLFLLRFSMTKQTVCHVMPCRETCLHVACFEGNVSAARYLLSLDADPNSAHTASGLNTPLHEAVRGGSLAATRLLLKSSANILATNAHGDLPLHVACRAGRLDIARRLLAHDSDWSTVGAVNHAGLRPSDVARRCTALSSLLKVCAVLVGRWMDGWMDGWMHHPQVNTACSATNPAVGQEIDLPKPNQTEKRWQTRRLGALIAFR